MPMFISPMLRCTFVSFTRWALTSRPDKVFISHPAPTQPLHISTFAPTVNLVSSNQNNIFIEIESSASLSIHLPLGGNFQVVSQEFHPNFFSLRFPPSFEIRLQTRNPNFSRMSDQLHHGVHGPEKLGLSVQELEMIRLVRNIFDRFQKHPLCVSFYLYLQEVSLFHFFCSQSGTLCLYAREREFYLQVVCTSCTSE